MAIGVVKPNTPQILPFIPDIYSNGYLAYDIIRFIIIIIMIVLTLIEYVMKSKGDKKQILKKIVSFTFLHLILIFILFLSLFIIKNAYCTNNASDFFNIASYEDGYKIGKMEEYSYYLECIFLLFICIKILSFLKLLSIMNLFFSSISISINMFIQYLLVMIGLLFGFTVVAELIWSPYMDTFKTFGMSFISVLLFTCGYYDVNELIKYNEGWGVVFIVVFFVFDLFLIFAIFNSIFAESLRRTIVKHGYPEDVEKEEWTLKDYTYWFLHYLPEKKQVNKVAK